VTGAGHEEAGYVVRRGRLDGPLLVRSLPREVPFGFLSRLLSTRRPFELRLQVHRVGRDRALETVRAAAAVADAEIASGASDDVAALELESESAHDLERRLAGNEQSLFRVGLSFHVQAGSAGALERERAELARRLGALGFVVRVPRHEAAAATGGPRLDGSEPRPRGYWQTLPTDGVAAFLPFVDEGVAEPGGVLVGLLLDDATPVFLDRWRHASHSWGIFGATGSGKSFAAALLALRTRWRTPGLEVYVVDPLGEFSGLAPALGAHVVGVGPGAPTLFHPLDPATTGGDRAEKVGRVLAMLHALVPSLTDEEVAVLDGALGRLYASDGPPTFAALAERLRATGAEGRLSIVFERFLTGSLQHFDRRASGPPPAGSLVVDLSAAPPEHRAFELAVVLDALYERLRRHPGPKLLVLDEAHLLTRDPATAEFLDRLVRHVRHFGTGVLILSQNPDDFLATRGGQSLLRNLRATLLLHLAEVSEATREFHSLTGAEAAWLPRARLPREAGYAEGLLRFGPSHLPLAVVASTPEHELIVRALSPGGDPSNRTFMNDGRG
jgi:hypothetical protein